jgi:ADP-ribose pyrophosphatase
LSDEAHAISKRRVYTGRVVSLDVDTVRFPNGAVGELEMLRHSGASAVVPFLDDRKSEDPRVLLIRQYRYATEGVIYEIPAGRLEPGEEPKACAIRELREETGYEARDVGFLTTFYTTPGFTDERIHIFIADAVNPGNRALESDEIVELCPVPLSEAIELIRTGGIVDGKTIIGLLFCARFGRFG